MRITITAALLLAATACSPSAKAPAGDEANTVPPLETSLTEGSDAKPNIAAPKREAGLWTFTDTAPNGDELAVKSLCVGEKSEGRYSAFQQIGNGGDCTKREFTQTATGYSYVTVCGVPNMKPVTTRGTLTGDVATGYTLEEELDLSVEGDHQKIVARRVGECPSNLADGQMKDGRTGMIYSVLTR